MTSKTGGQLDASALLQNAKNFWVYQSPGAFVSNHCQALAIVLSGEVLSFGVFECSGQHCFGITCCLGCQAQVQKRC